MVRRVPGAAGVSSCRSLGRSPGRGKAECSSQMSVHPTGVAPVRRPD